MSSRRRSGMGWFSTLLEGGRVAFDSLRANKVRSGLTILGVTIGVMVVMVMAAVITGINTSFTELIASRGPTTFYVSHAPFGGGSVTVLDEDEPEWLRNPPLDTRWVAELGRLPGILDATAYADLGGMGYQAKAGSEQVGITLGGAAPNFLEIDAGDLMDGRFFTETEDERRRAVAVIDSATARDLFGGRDPIGKTILIGQRSNIRAPFQVIGVYRPPPNLFAGLASHYVLVPFHSAEKHIDFWDRLVSFIIRPAPGTTQQEAMDAVYGRMRQLRHLRPGEDDNFAVITNDEIFNVWSQMTGVLFAVMVALSGVGLMVGGVGVIGIMMISVTERTREIGL
ncbi:MAG: ABC transporter permease, partial [Gemmatimonadota bacterium]